MEENVKEKVKEIFGKNAGKYVSSPIHAQGDDLPLLVDWLQPESTWLVLDIATGGGHVSKALAPHAGTVISTDLTEEMLANTARHLKPDYGNILYVIADAEALPFLADTFDAAICRIAAHHFPHPEAFAAEAARVLKPGGKFVLIDNVAPEDPGLARFMNTTEKLRDDSHARCLPKSEWQALFKRNGLTELGAIDRKKTFQFPSWAARTAENEGQKERVRLHLLEADEETAVYFQLKVRDGAIESFVIDEWMALYQK